MSSSQLPTPPSGPDAVGWVAEHLGDLCLEDRSEIRASERFEGGQQAAQQRLDALDISGYSKRRNEVWPDDRRGASAMSPYIRHGLLGLRRVWDHVADAPARDRTKYRDELLWQEYARHLYARVGSRNGAALRYEPAREGEWDEPWPRWMACVDLTAGELERDGWLVNQTRMWLASQWTVRAGAEWTAGEDRFFAHLLDGSRAANRLGWQWAIGSGTGRPYGFSRWQVRKRAPGLCDRCELSERCPIEQWPDAERGPKVEPPESLRSDPDIRATAGPAGLELGNGDPEVVWITAESLGDEDPALAAEPELPVVFVFDEALLERLRLSGKRLVFLAQCLADLAQQRDLEVVRGDPAEVLQGRRVASTFTPVPGWRRLARRIGPAAVHPWPWLARPHDGPLGSYSAWRKRLGRV